MSDDAPPGLGPRGEIALAYWQGLRRGRHLPARTDIDPAEIPKLLPGTILVDVLRDPLDFRYRLVGTAIVETYGEELTGRFVDELFTPARRALAMRHYALAFGSARPIAARNRYTNVRGAELIASRILLPLSEDGVNVSMLLIGQTCAYAVPGREGLRRDTVLTEDQVEFLDAGALTPVG